MKYVVLGDVEKIVEYLEKTTLDHGRPIGNDYVYIGNSTFWGQKICVLSSDIREYDAVPITYNQMVKLFPIKEEYTLSEVAEYLGKAISVLNKIKEERWEKELI